MTVAAGERDASVLDALVEEETRTLRLQLLEDVRRGLTDRERLLLDSEHTHARIAAGLGVHRGTVGRTWAALRARLRERDPAPD